MQDRVSRSNEEGVRPPRRRDRDRAVAATQVPLQKTSGMRECRVVRQAAQRDFKRVM